MKILINHGEHAGKIASVITDGGHYWYAEIDATKLWVRKDECTLKPESNVHQVFESIINSIYPKK